MDLLEHDYSWSYTLCSVLRKTCTYAMQHIQAINTPSLFALFLELLSTSKFNNHSCDVGSGALFPGAFSHP